MSRDVVGLCIDPPDHAVVLSAEESEDANATGPGERANRIQALGRTRKPLPVTPGHAVTRTHDCRRHGTTCLLAARDVATGKVVGRTVDRHRSQEFLAFPDPVAEGDRTRNPGACHPRHRLVARVRTWPKGRPDRTFRFTPTPASRTNAVKGFFPRLSGQRPKDAAFDPLDECITAIEGCIAHHDAHHARPFRWSRKPEDLVEACKGGHRRLQEMAPDA